MRFESKRGSKRKEKKEKKVLEVGKFFFVFGLLIFFCISKMISKS
jgi:hypothetical protein